VNLTTSDLPFEIELPVPPMFVSSEGPVLEVVFWSKIVGRWIHGVSLPFERSLPSGRVQVSLADMEWIKNAVAELGDQGLRECVRDLELSLIATEDEC